MDGVLTPHAIELCGYAHHHHGLGGTDNLGARKSNVATRAVNASATLLMITRWPITKF